MLTACATCVPACCKTLPSLAGAPLALVLMAPTPALPVVLCIWFQYVGVSENSVSLDPMVNDHYPYQMAIIGNIPYFQTNPYVSISRVLVSRIRWHHFLERAINLTSSKCIPVFSMTASQLMRLAWTLCQRRDTCIKFIGRLWALQDTLWSEIGILEILLDLCALRRLYVWLGSQLGKQEGIWQQVSPCRLPVVNSFSRPFIKGLHRFDVK